MSAILASLLPMLLPFVAKAITGTVTTYVLGHVSGLWAWLAAHTKNLKLQAAEAMLEKLTGPALSQVLGTLAADLTGKKSAGDVAADVFAVLKGTVSISDLLPVIQTLIGAGGDEITWLLNHLAMKATTQAAAAGKALAVAPGDMDKINALSVAARRALVSANGVKLAAA